MFYPYDGVMIDLARVVHYDGDELHLEGGHRFGYYQDRTDEQNQQNSEVESKLRSMAGFVSYGVEAEFFNIKYVVGYEVEGGDNSGVKLTVLMANGAELQIYDDDDVAPVLKALGHPE